jgi:peptide-methionine (S)-S-oxide reductase
MAVKGKIYTEILPLSTFYRAEDYHQKYYLRRNSWIAEDFQAVYPGAKEFTDSTAAARVNGYLAGFGSIENLKKEIKDFGLSKETEKKLLQTVQSRGHWFR